MPYKQILINVHENFKGRLRTLRKGPTVKGIHSGLSCKAYMAFLFEINEYLPKDHKLTDYQIARAICDEFPGRIIPQKLFEFECGKIKWVRRYALSTYRSLYNTGSLLHACPRHGPISYRYDERGNRLGFRTNRPMDDKEAASVMERYGPENRMTQDFDWKALYKPKKIPPNSTYDSFNWSI